MQNNHTNLKWNGFCECLKRQVVRKINGSISPSMSVVRGVPYGYVFDLILFPVYLNDLPDSLQGDVLLLLIFARATLVISNVTFKTHGPGALVRDFPSFH